MKAIFTIPGRRPAHFYAPLVALTLLSSVCITAQISENGVDQLVANTMKTFDVPGIAVGVVKDGRVVLAKGYGVNNINTGEKTDANTLFGIASNSKAFTTAALAMLADQGKLSWDDKVTKYIPEFRMYNDDVTTGFTIRDLLTHRSGLGLGAGDLMIWPDGHNFTPEDIIANIHFLKPVSGFRTKYDYDNLLYVIAGEIVHRVSGMSWDDYIAANIMKPLGFERSAPSWKTLKDTANAVSPHVPTDGKLKVVRRYTNRIFDSAAGIYASVNDISKWVIMQLADGKLPDGTRLISEKQHAELWTPQTIMPLRDPAPYKSLFKCYALGWQLQDFNGHLQVSHTGGLDGMVTQVLLIPDMKLGIIVLTNQQSGAAFTAISNTIKDRFLGLPAVDHVAALKAERQSRENDADKVTDGVWQAVALNQKKKHRIDNAKYVGSYNDPWFGRVNIADRKGRLFFSSERSPRLTGEVFYYRDNDFIVKWNERSFGADAHIFFDCDAEGKATHFTMKPVSPLTDFSYDFQDLDFSRIEGVTGL